MCISFKFFGLQTILLTAAITANSTEQTKVETFVKHNFVSLFKISLFSEPCFIDANIFDELR